MSSSRCITFCARIVLSFAAALGCVASGEAPSPPAAALAADAAAADAAAARYTADGRLTFPTGYREWVFLTSGLDMNYSSMPMEMGGSLFDNVFVSPRAYAEFVRTAHWPDGTVLVKESRQASTRGSINRHGKFQRGDAVVVEVHVHDSARFPGGWAFFIFGKQDPAVRVAEGADCYECHRRNGAVETTFVQFYPTLLPLANAHGEALGALDAPRAASPPR